MKSNKLPIGLMHRGRLLEETDLKELLQINRNYVEFKVSDVNMAALLLEQQFQIFDYRVIDSSCVRVFEQMDRRGEINSRFVENGMIVFHISICEEKLEEYFTKQIQMQESGGDGIAGYRVL